MRPSSRGSSRHIGESGRSGTGASFAGTSARRPPTRPSSFGSAISAPRAEDAIAIAALYACLIRRITHEIEQGRQSPAPPRELIEEGRWLAQRYGTFAFLPEHGRDEARSVAEIATDLVTRLSPHARALDCEGALRHVIRIAEQGASAERQEDTYREALLDGASESEALRAVVDQIITDTESTVGDVQG